MNVVSDKTFLQIFKQALSKNFELLKRTFLIIVLLTMVKNIYVYFSKLFTNDFLHVGFVVIILLCAIFLLSMLFLCVDKIVFKVLESKLISKNSYRIAQSCKIIAMRIVKIYMACVLLIALILLIYGIAKLLIFLIIALVGNQKLITALGIMILAGLPSIYLLLKFYFTIPLLACADITLKKAFLRSFSLVNNKARLSRVFGLYACSIAIVVLISPDTLHGHFLATYHLTIPFDLIVLSVTLPLLVSMIVLMLGDMEKNKT